MPSGFVFKRNHTCFFHFRFSLMNVIGTICSTQQYCLSKLWNSHWRCKRICRYTVFLDQRQTFFSFNFSIVPNQHVWTSVPVNSTLKSPSCPLLTPCRDAAQRGQQQVRERRWPPVIRQPLRGEGASPSARRRASSAPAAQSTTPASEVRDGQLGEQAPSGRREAGGWVRPALGVEEGQHLQSPRR